MLYRPWSLEAERIEGIDLVDEIPSMDIGLIWSRAKELSNVADAFRKYCRSEVALRRMTSALDGGDSSGLFD